MVDAAIELKPVKFPFFVLFFFPKRIFQLVSPPTFPSCSSLVYSSIFFTSSSSYRLRAADTQNFVASIMLSLLMHVFICT